MDQNQQYSGYAQFNSGANPKGQQQYPPTQVLQMSMSSGVPINKGAPPHNMQK